MSLGPFSAPFSFTTVLVPPEVHTPQPTLAQQREAVRIWVASCLPLNWPAIFADQNSPRPTSLSPAAPGYAAIRIDAMIKKGLRDFQYPPQQLDTSIFNRTLIGSREFTASISAFGPGSLQSLEDLRTCLDRDSVLDTFRLAGLAVVQSLPIQNLTGLYDTQMTERGNFDVRFRVAATTDDRDVSYIQKVEGEATLSSPPRPDIVEPYTVELP